MNSQSLEAAGAVRKFFRPATIGLACLVGLLWLAASFVPVRAAESPLPVGNYPGIYVAKALPEVTNGLGCWMWDQQTFNKQTVRLWHRFDVPAPDTVTHVEIRIAADNAFKISIDGQQLGSGSDWRTLSIYHLEGALKSGPHVLAVEGFNDNDQAGVILGMRMELSDGKVMRMQSDLTWRIAPDTASDWETALVPGADWPYSANARNFGRVPWWDIPISVLHIPGTLPKPVPLWETRNFQIGLFSIGGVLTVICLYLLIQLVSQSKAHHLLQAERDRIARDIHDDLGSKLTQLLLTGEMAQMESAPPPGTPILQMCDGARNILSTIDEVIWIVNSQHDNLDDFVIYICKYAENFLSASAIRCRFDVPHDLPATRLSQLGRRNLFLAVKEALNNTAKHSGAAELTVRIELTGPRLNVVVADNGCGFDFARATQERNGLTNMKLRMAEIGGDCQIASRPGEGCQVTFHVPLKQRSFFKSLFRWGNPDDSAPALAAGPDEVFPPAKTAGFPRRDDT